MNDCEGLMGRDLDESGSFICEWMDWLCDGRGLEILTRYRVCKSIKEV